MLILKSPFRLALCMATELVNVLHKNFRRRAQDRGGFAVSRAFTGLSGAAGIESEWDLSDNNQRAKFYKLTRTGRKQLILEEQNWERLAGATMKALRAS